MSIKNITLIALSLSCSSLFACMPHPTYIDFSKINKSISIETERPVIMRSNKSITWNENKEFKIDKTKSRSIGGMFLYQLRPITTPTKSTLIAKSVNKEVRLHMRIKKR
jgi:hypothetical protein